MLSEHNANQYGRRISNTLYEEETVLGTFQYRLDFWWHSSWCGCRLSNTLHEEETSAWDFWLGLDVWRHPCQLPAVRSLSTSQQLTKLRRSLTRQHSFFRAGFGGDGGYSASSRPLTQNISDSLSLCIPCVKHPHVLPGKKCLKSVCRGT